MYRYFEKWVDGVAFKEEYRHIWLGVSVENQKAADERIPLLLQTPAAIKFVSVEPMLGPIDLISPIEDWYWCEKCGYLGEKPDEEKFWCTGCDEVRSWDEDTFCNGGFGECKHCGNMDDGHLDRMCPRCGESEAWAFGTVGTASRVQERLGEFIDWVICGGESGPGARPMHPDWPRRLRDQSKEAGKPFFFKQWGEWLPINQFPEVYRNNAAIYLGNHKEYEFCDKNKTYRVGKHRAGSQLDGREWNEMPEIKK